MAKDKLAYLGSLIDVNKANSEESDSELLQRIYLKLKLYLSPGAIAAFRGYKNKNNEESTSKNEIGTYFPSLAEFPLSFGDDMVVDDNVRDILLIIRMLYLADYSDLQKDVNALLVLGQEYTANPRLNSNLGKVGR